MVNNELLALVPILSDSYYNAMVSTTIITVSTSLTLGIRAPAAIPRASNDTPRMNKETIQSYNTQIKTIRV